MLFKCQMSSGCTPFRVPLVYFAALEGITQKGVELPISRAIGKLHQLPHVKEVTGLMFWELRRKELQTMAFPLATSCRWQVGVEENTTFCSTYTCYRLSTFYVCPVSLLQYTCPTQAASGSSKQDWWFKWNSAARQRCWIQQNLET